MRKNMRIRAVLFVLFFLLIIGAIFYIIWSGNNSKSEAYVPGFSIRDSGPLGAENTAAPAETPEAKPRLSTPAPTPVPTATPEPTPAPTVYIPTPEPATPLGSGTFSSGKPWLLNIHADWSAVAKPGGYADVEIVVYVDHYSLTYSSHPLVIKLGDNYQSLDATAIETSSNKKQSTELGRYTFTVPLAAGESLSLPLSCVWEFIGTYMNDAKSPVEIYKISCEGTISLKR